MTMVLGLVVRSKERHGRRARDRNVIRGREQFVVYERSRRRGRGAPRNFSSGLRNGGGGGGEGWRGQGGGGIRNLRYASAAAEKLLPAAGRDEQRDDDRDRFLDMRKKYLADGSYSPMSEMISLLAYSKHAALNQGNAGNAYWSADKKIFYLHGRPIVIESFRKMAQSMEAEVVEQFWQLCWVDIVADRFTIDLAQISDDVAFTTRGESFVTNPAKRLSNVLAWMPSTGPKQGGRHAAALRPRTTLQLQALQRQPRLPS